jgi:hypothetical protein
MTDRDFDVHAYDQGYRDGRHDAAAEIDRLRAALDEAAKDLDDWGAYTKANKVRAALGDEK